MSEQAKQLLGQIAEVAKKTGHAPSYIGMQAVKDARIVEKLNRGAVLLSTAAKLAAFLEQALTPATEQPAPGAPVQSARPMQSARPKAKAKVKAPKNVAKGRARAKR